MINLLLYNNQAKSETISVNLRDYLYQTPPNNQMLCDGNAGLCTKAFVTSDQEIANVYTNGIIDYTARSNTSPYFIGVVRYIDPTEPDPNQRNQLRCFGQKNAPCSAPPNVAYPPQSAPQIFNVNVASPQDELAGDNPGGSPRQPIRGAVSLTNNTTVDFSINVLNPTTCAQTLIGGLGHQVTAVFVRQLYFGGDLGYKDTLIIDEYETGPTLPQYHMERYYYVNGYGRVREGAAYYDTTAQVYTHPISYSLRNLLRANTIAQPAEPCPQGSAPLQ